MTDASAIVKTIIHPQWGAPMEYHVLDKFETDRTSNTTRLQYSSYYNKSVYTTGGMYMTSTVIRLEHSIFADAMEASKHVAELKDNDLSGGKPESITDTADPTEETEDEA